MSNSNSVIAPKHLTVRVQKILGERKSFILSGKTSQTAPSHQKRARRHPQAKWNGDGPRVNYSSEILSQKQEEKKKNKDSFPKALKLL